MPDPLQQARALHKQGRLAEASAAYAGMLRTQPQNPELLHLAGIAALQSGQGPRGVTLLERAVAAGAGPGARCDLAAGLRTQQRQTEALAQFEAACAAAPTHAPAHFGRGLVLADIQRHTDALKAFDQALTLHPTHAGAHAARGLALAELGDLDAALASHRRAAELRPDAKGFANCGLLLAQLGRPAEALEAFTKAAALRPEDAELHYRRGRLLTEIEPPLPAEALKAFDAAIARQPTHADAHLHRARLLARLARREDALQAYEAALALRPDNAAALTGRGAVLADLHRYDEALASCTKAVELQPDFADAHADCGVVLARLQRPQQALASYDRAIKLNPAHVVAHTNRGVVLAELHNHPAALESYDRAVAVRPDHAAAWWNRSLSLLATGDYARGWALYEWRKRRDMPVANRVFPQPLWLGDAPLAGKTLFIHWEQGFGDTLQFSRYANLAAQQGARVIMSVQEPLRRVMASLGPEIEIIGPDSTPAEFDFHCPMMSLPLAFGTSLETVPASVPYLAAGHAPVSDWSTRLAGERGPRIGICWAGNPRGDFPSAHAIDRRRSMALAEFAPLAGIPGIQWISLQKGTPAAQAAAPPAGMALLDWTAELNDFADTAALMSALDLVITVDTSVAHLAGALGKKTWILSRYDSCWRWLMQREDSPWYPTARLFRQTQPGDWQGVMQAVREALEKEEVLF